MEGLTKDRSQPSAVIVNCVRLVCAELPDVLEVQAWTGTSWRVRDKTFAHVLVIENGWPSAYVNAAGTAGPATILTFQSEGLELEALTAHGHPFFRPRWRPGIVGMSIDDYTNWEEVAELVIESYCILAPTGLSARLDRPPP
jgi:hypothetical protein